MNQESAKKEHEESDKLPTAKSRRAVSRPGAVDPPKGNSSSQSEQRPTTEKGDVGKRRDPKEAGGKDSVNTGGLSKTVPNQPPRVTKPPTNQTKTVRNEVGAKSVPSQPTQKETIIPPINKTTPKNENDAGARPEGTRKGGITTGGDTLIQTDVVPVKAVLKMKTDGEPSATSGKKHKTSLKKEHGAWNDVGAKPVPSQPTQETIPPTNKTTPNNGNDGSARPEETIKGDIITGGDTLIQTNGVPVKSVINRKKDDEPSAPSGKKRKQSLKKEHTLKSVTFVSEPSVASPVAVTTQRVTIRSSIKTGFGEMSAKDFSVMLGFWFMRFFIPWFVAWHNFNFYLLREPSFWDPLKKDIQTGEIIVFSVMCVITVSLAVFADFINFRFYIFSVLLLLSVLCPITGAFLNDALVARAYDQDYYRKWSFVSEMLFNWTSAIAFVIFPIQLSCIFTHKDNMSRQAHYNWTAVLVFLESVNRYIAFWVIPGKCPTKTFTQTAIWFLIGVVIFVVFLLTTNFFFEWAKPELMHSKWYTQKSTKYNEEGSLNAKTKWKKFIWFSSTLVFVIFTSFVYATLERLRPDEDWDKHYIVSATSMFHLGEILGVPFMVVSLFVILWKLQHYRHLPFLQPNVLALGLPHIITFTALVALVGRYATLSHLREGDIIVGPIPENQAMVVEFYNFDFRNRTVCVNSSAFRPLKIGPRQRGTREIYDLGLSRIHFAVTLDPQTTPALRAFDSFQYQEDTCATFLITLPAFNLKYSDVQALYSKPEIVRVEGTQLIRPKKKPQIFFMNTFVTKKSKYESSKFYVEQNNSGFHHELESMVRWQAVILEVPAGHLEIAHHLVESTGPPQTVRTTIEADNYSVWCVLLGHARPMKEEETVPIEMLKAYKTMETAGPDSGRHPNKAQLQRDWLVMTGMTLAGMASSGIFIGAIYLFWVDTPFIAYRTICIGVFWVLVEIPVELSKIKVVDIGLVAISILAFLQIICTVLHFITAAQLYKPEFNFRPALPNP